MVVFCGIDWAEDHHDVALVDPDGTLVAKRRIGDDAGRYSCCAAARRRRRQRRTHRSRWRSRPPAGCWSPACARPAGRYSRSTRWRSPATATGTRSQARSPTPATRWCWPTSCAPTWPRTGRCRPTPNWPRPIAVLARAQQDAVWDRTNAHNKLRSLLREYYPAFLAAFADKRGGLLRPEARAILAAAPTPAPAPRSPHPATGAAQPRRPPTRHRRRSRPAARRSSRRYLRQPPLVEEAYGPPGPRPAAQLWTSPAPTPTTSPPPRSRISSSTRTPRSSPACQARPLTGARVLAEIGDDRSRFTDARALKAYAGAAPVTRASGKSPPSCTAGSRTNASPAPATSGHSPR